MLCACGAQTSPQDAGTSDAGDTTPDGGTQVGGGGADGGTGVPVEVHVRATFPGTGPTAGGGTVLISGSGFAQGFSDRGGAAASALTHVHVGTAAASAVNVIDDNRVEVTLPAGPPGAADVSVTNPNGTGTCTGCFRYVTPLRVTSVDPPAGTTAGGTQVTVHGDGFTRDLLVLVAGRELIGLDVVDAQTATGQTPPGTSGGADVLAVTRDGRGELRRGFVYADALRVDAAVPFAVPTAGGVKVRISGAGFSAQAQVSIGGTLATSVWVDDHTLDAVAPAAAAGPADLTVTDPGALGGAASATLHQGFAYADAGGPLALYALAPQGGPVSGGVCPQACVHLAGSGLSAADLAVTIGGIATTVHGGSDIAVDADLPAAASAGLADITATAGGATVTLSQAFRYTPALSVASITPASGPATGGTAISIAGSGFDQAATLSVRIGALAATLTQQSPLTATTPGGAPGAADVTITATYADGSTQTATLPAAFTFTTPLQLTQIAPALGAQAGGTRITLYGRGFTSALTASIGAGAVTLLAVQSANVATGFTPPGAPGAKPVLVSDSGATDSVQAAFTYYDPTSELGGATGGDMLGTLNVTVLDDSAYKTGGVPGATLIVTLPDQTQLRKATDANGQVTFSDARLVVPVRVTALATNYTSMTVDAVQAPNLTLSLYGPPGPPPPPPDPPPPPPAPLQPATVGGHVYGFKLPPNLALGPTQRQVARVAIARQGIYALPPFAGPVQFQSITADGGAFTFDKLYNLSPTTLYAVFGIEDTSAHTFEPYLLGVLRNVIPDPTNAITDADIILDTHLDQAVDAQVLNPPSTLAANDAYVSLDLGPSGAIPLDHVLSTGDVYQVKFSHLPKAMGQGLVFVLNSGRWDGTQVTYPVSIYLRRVFGDVETDGVTLGPLLPFPVVTRADATGFSWTVAQSPLMPNLQQIRLEDSAGQQDTSWSAVLPGELRAIDLPDEVRTRLRPGTHSWTIVTSQAPSFDFAHWNSYDLYSGSWTAYAYNIGSLTAP